MQLGPDSPKLYMQRKQANQQENVFKIETEQGCKCSKLN